MEVRPADALEQMAPLAVAAASMGELVVTASMAPLVVVERLRSEFVTLLVLLEAASAVATAAAAATAAMD